MSLLETVHLKKYFGDTHAVDDVNLTIEEGEFISLVGPNGAGKTSFCNVVSAYYSADSGKIIFQGEDVSNASVTQRVKAGIARSFQLVNLFDDLTAFDNVALAIFSREGKTRNIAALARRDSEVTREADAVLNQFGLAGKRNELARGLAHGGDCVRRLVRHDGPEATDEREPMPVQPAAHSSRSRLLICERISRTSAAFMPVIG